MAVKEEHNKEHDESIPFFPDHARTEAVVGLGVLIVIVIIGIWGHLAPIGIEEPADPLNTPDHTKPEWYFLFLYQFLKYVPKTVGVMVPIVGIILLVIWPFIERNPKDLFRARRFRIAIVVAFLIIFTLLTALGASA